MKVKFVNTSAYTVIFQSEGNDIRINPNDSIVLNSDYDNMELSLTPDAKCSINKDKLFEGYYNFIVKAYYSISLSSDCAEIYLTAHTADGADIDSYTFISAYSKDIKVNGVRYETVVDEISEQIKKKKKKSYFFEKLLDYFFFGPFELSIVYIVLAVILIKAMGFLNSIFILLTIAALFIAIMYGALKIGGEIGNSFSKGGKVPYKSYKSYFDSEYIASRIEEYYKSN